jgi:phage FluMu protein Com
MLQDFGPSVYICVCVCNKLVVLKSSTSIESKCPRQQTAHHYSALTQKEAQDGEEKTSLASTVYCQSTQANLFIIVYN